MKAVHVVVPDGIDDPARPSGGNTYDRQVCRGLGSIGWSVHEHPMSGSWPQPDAASLARLDGVLKRIPDDAVVLIDGLVASAASEVLVPQERRLRLVVLVHMPLGHRPPKGGSADTRTREGQVLAVATAVVTTSAWARRRLLELYPQAAGTVHVAEPGVEPAELAAGSAEGQALLCVGVVTPDKGHDLLLEALRALTDLAWRCDCVGSLDRNPKFVETVGRSSLATGLRHRVSFPGPRTGGDLDRSYAGADLLVLPSRVETYGMVVTEALARAVPVVAADVGGVTEALGRGADGTRPGLLVPPENPAALGAALRAWFGDAELRTRLRQAARERRESLPRWSTTTSVVASVLAAAAR